MCVDMPMLVGIRRCFRTAGMFVKTHVSTFRSAVDTRFQIRRRLGVQTRVVRVWGLGAGFRVRGTLRASRLL